MGFGILFFGYFTAFAFIMVPTYFYADIVGCAVMIPALSMLSSHKPKFRRCLYLDAALAAVSVLGALGRTFGFAPPDSTPGTVINVLWLLFALTFHVFLTGAILSLARDAEDRRIENRASFNRSFSVTVYTVSVAAAILRVVLPAEANDVAGKLTLLLSFACVLSMSFLIYSAFANFVPVSGEVKEPAPSRIPLVNKIRRKNYERKVRIMNENREMYEEYVKEKNAPAPKKKKKKK